MKSINIFSFSELSDSAKENALNQLRSLDYYDNYDEITASWDKFTEVLPNDYTDYYDEIMNLSGVRLLKYLWNNYKNVLYKGRYYRVKGKVKPHKRIKTSGNFQAYYSAIQLENDCPLTGCTYDMEILDPIYSFMAKPDNTSFKTLIKRCTRAYEKAIEAEEEYSQSDEYLSEMAEANDYTFFESGKICNA